MSSFGVLLAQVGKYLKRVTARYLRFIKTHNLSLLIVLSVSKQVIVVMLVEGQISTTVDQPQMICSMRNKLLIRVMTIIGVQA